MVRLNTDRAADPLAAGIERFVGLEHIEPQDLRIRRWGFVADGTTFTNRFRPGQVLFGKRRAYQRKVAVADFEGVCSSDIYVFESKDPDVLLPELLPFLCQTDGFFQHAVGTSAGSLSPRTNWTQLAAYAFALPPLEEQRQIAKVLQSALCIADAYSELLKSIGQVAQSFCRHVVQAYPENQFVEVGEVAKFTSGKQLKVTELPTEPSTQNPVPVFGGNGISGYTLMPLPGIPEQVVVVGRVGQFCGVTHVTDRPSWITDNALYPAKLDSSMNMRFLAICLRGVNLNQGKLGEYLPLITQKVVHSVRIRCPSLEAQRDWVEAYDEIGLASELVSKRTSEAISVYRLQMNMALVGT